MFTKWNGHKTISRLAKELGVYPELILCLCEANGIVVLSREGVRFLSDESVLDLRRHLAAWLTRPQLKIHHRRRRRKRRPYRFLKDLLAPAAIQPIETRSRPGDVAQADGGPLSTPRLRGRGCP